MCGLWGLEQQDGAGSVSRAPPGFPSLSAELVLLPLREMSPPYPPESAGGGRARPSWYGEHLSFPSSRGRRRFEKQGVPGTSLEACPCPGSSVHCPVPALRAQVPSRPLYLRQTFSAAVRRGALASVQRRRRQPRTRENLVPHFRRCSASASGIYGLWKPQDGFVQQSGVFLPLTSSPTGNVSPLLCCFFLFLFLGLEIDQGAKGAEKKNALRRCFLHLGGGGTHVSLDNSR